MNPLGLTYCESIVDGLFAQSWNSLSNVPFFIVAFLLWQGYQRTPNTTRSLKYLCLSPILIGLGSTIWHATMLGWTLALDVSSIGVFAAFFIFYGMRQILNKPLWMTFLTIIGVILIGAITTKLTVDVIPQKSGGFIPLALILCSVGWRMSVYKKQGAGFYYGAGASMLCAIVFRVMDTMICPVMPMGTHWLWHCFTALAAYLMVKPLLSLNKMT